MHFKNTLFVTLNNLQQNRIYTIPLSYLSCITFSAAGVQTGRRPIVLVYKISQQQSGKVFSSIYIFILFTEKTV